MGKLLSPAMNEFMDHLEKTLPDGLLTAPQLVAAGIVKSPTTLYSWRDEGRGPPYLRLEDGVCRYLKKDVLNWIKEGFSNG